MTQARRKLDAATTPRSPERRQLAEKIERAGALRERLGRIRVALEENPPYRALAAKDRAEEALQRARDVEKERAIARILGDPLPEGPSLEEAQRALDAAAREYDRILQAAETLTQGEAEARRMLEFAEIGVHDAIAAVASPALAELLGRYETAQKEVARLRLTLESVSRFLARDQLRALQVVRDFRDVAADPALSAWSAALATDPEAPAPELA